MTGEQPVSVPVQRDPRTFEERRRAMFNRLRTRTQPHAPTSKVSVEAIPYSRHWFQDVNRWADDKDRGWDYDLRRMRDDMLLLMPIDIFVPPTQSFFTPLGDVPSILNQMNRQLEAMRQLGPSGLGLNGQAVAGHVKNGGALKPGSHERPLDYLKDAYEVGEDGRVHFKLRFDMQGYDPEDIHVTKSEHAINIHAKHMTQTDSSSCKREFSRTMYLPDSVDADKFQCHLTEDKILMLEAPVKATTEPSLTFNREQQLSVKPSEASQKQVTPADKQLVLKPTGVMGSRIHDNKLHVEVPVDPEFGAEDLCVRMDKNCVIVSGKKEFHEETGTSKSVYVKEFSRSYDVPETVDTFSVQSELHGGTLVVEAPLLTPSTSST